MLAVRHFFGKLTGGSRGCRRNFREERGDFTIALMIFSVVLITAATVAYTWPKSASTRFTTQHVATQALRAGIASVADDAAASRDPVDNKCYAREAVKSVIDDYRIHGVVMNIADPTINPLGAVDERGPEGCENLGVPQKEFLENAFPRCVTTGNGEAYLLLTIQWYFTNPGSLVGTQVSSRASAQEPIPPALIMRLC